MNKRFGKGRVRGDRQIRKVRAAMAEALEQRVLFTMYTVPLGNPIQPVIDGAVNGDTINLVAGHYVEQLTVNGKNITINGAGEGVTFLDAPTTLANSFTTGINSNKAVVSFMNTGNGSVLNLTIDGLSHGNANSRFIGLAYRNAGGLVSHVGITNIKNSPLDNAQAGIGFYGFADNGTNRSLVVSSTHVSNYQKAGMMFSGANLNVIASNNTVSGAGPTSVLSQNGIQIGTGAMGSLQENTVTGNLSTATSNGQGIGILITQAGGMVNLLGNDVQQNGGGIYADTTVDVGQNTLNSNVYGLQLYGTMTTSTVHNNFIQNNSLYGIYLDSTISAPVPVQNNSITGNTQYGLVNLSVFTINASKNWWNDTRGPTTITTFGGDAVFGPVNFTPWLMNGVDEDLDTAGFQPTDQVIGRFTFYNHSAYDGNSTVASAADNSAIAPDKTALLPGGTATFANYTSYSNGINGILIDVLNLAQAGSISTADFEFKVGNSSDLSSWIGAPTPASIVVRAGQGPGGSDRIDIVWADGAIVGKWLQVRVLANSRTGLPQDDIFYFGNAPGEIGDDPTRAEVNSADEIGPRAFAGDLSFSPPATALANVYDFNRDRVVNAADEAVAGANYTFFLNALQLISVPLVTPHFSFATATGNNAVSNPVWPKLPDMPAPSPADPEGAPVVDAMPPAPQDSAPATVPGATTLTLTTTQTTPANKKKGKGPNGPHGSHGTPPKIVKHHSKMGFTISFSTPTSKVRPMSTVKDSSKRLQELRLIFEQNGSDASGGE